MVHRHQHCLSHDYALVKCQIQIVFPMTSNIYWHQQSTRTKIDRIGYIMMSDGLIVAAIVVDHVGSVVGIMRFMSFCIV